jgi:hypothetical protein
MVCLQVYKIISSKKYIYLTEYIHYKTFLTKNNQKGQKLISKLLIFKHSSWHNQNLVENFLMLNLFMFIFIKCVQNENII